MSSAGGRGSVSEANDQEWPREVGTPLGRKMLIFEGMDFEDIPIILSKSCLFTHLVKWTYQLAENER
jgi:hypothetical protein